MKYNEKGSVTMIVVVTILFIVILLSSFLIYTSARRRAQIKETEAISKAYDGDMNEIYTNIIEENDPLISFFDTTYGRIDVIWIDLENNVIDKPLAPILNGMTPVKWNGITEITTNENDTSWYNYTGKEGAEDNRESKWANAKDSKGSYFVWIPRFAYRITYYNNEERVIPTGYCDGRGIVDNKGNIKYKLDEGTEIVKTDDKSYIVHPAFETNLDLGGWEKDLAGIWVGKYESSGSISDLKIIPETRSFGAIMNDAYTSAYNYNRNKESHLIKNSEWGAVAYLTYSQYGRNGNEIDINNSSSYITGNGGGSVDASSQSGEPNPYNTDIGQKASSTGNIYGIYDLSGGKYERVAIFNAQSNNLVYGNEFASTNGSSTKYATAYVNSSETKSGRKIYEVGKIGDATKEVYTNYERKKLE